MQRKAVTNLFSSKFLKQGLLLLTILTFILIVVFRLQNAPSVKAFNLLNLFKKKERSTNSGENNNYKKGTPVHYNVPQVAKYSRIIVKYKNKQYLLKTYKTSKAKNILAQTNAKLDKSTGIKSLQKLGAYQVFNVDPKKAVAFVNSYKNLPGVEKVYYVPIATVNAVSGWTTITSNGVTKDYPSDFDNPNDPLNGRHWYIEKAHFPEFWHAIGCANGSDFCAQKQPIVIAIIDTGVATSGTADSPTVANFTYTNTCSDSNNDGEITADECLLPIPEEGDLNFSIKSAVSSQLDSTVFWTNPNESATPECNDIHGVDLEIYEYNENNGIAQDCSLDQRKKEGIPADDYGHGTFIAHIIAATTNDTTTPGPVALAPNIKIMPIKANIPFTGMFYVDRLAEAIVYAVDNGAKVINMSVSTGYDVDVLRNAMQYAKDHNVVIVAATGNAGQDSLEYPAAYTTEFDNVIAVAARNKYGEITGYSNYTPDAFTAYVGDGATDATNTIKSMTISCDMDSSGDYDCAPTKNESTGIYEKDNTSFIDTNHIGTSFAAPQITAVVGELIARDNNITTTTIHRLLNKELPSPSAFDKTINLYSAYELPYLTTQTNLYVSEPKTSLSFSRDIPITGSLEINPKTFVLTNQPWNNNLELINVLTGETSNANKAWWFSYSTGFKTNTVFGQTNFRTLIPDFGNADSDTFFMGNFIDTPATDSTQDAGEDAAVVRFTPDSNGENTNIKLYIASRTITNQTDGTITETLNYVGYPSLDYNSTFAANQLTAFMADVNNDGKDDLILQVTNSDGSSNFYVSLWNKDSSTGQILFTTPNLWASNIGATNDMYYFADINNDGKADLIRGHIANATTVEWYFYPSTNNLSGGVFGSETQLTTDIGNKGDIFMFKDLNNDNYPDLVVIRVNSDTQVTWYGSLNDQNNALSTPFILDQDFGNYGDQFYMADINNDGTADPIVIRHSSITGSELGGQYTRGLTKVFVKLTQNNQFQLTTDYNITPPEVGDIIISGNFTDDSYTDIAIGRHLGPKQIAWYILKNNGDGTFAAPTLWQNDYGDLGDTIYAGDFNGDGLTDLYLRRVDNPLKISWYISTSAGDSFSTGALIEADFGNAALTDKWYIADTNGDGKDDILLSRLVEPDHVRWYVETSNGTSLNYWTIWKEDFGNNYTNDNYFITDINGDNKRDLLLGRINSSDPSEITWYYSLSDNDTFGTVYTLINDYGNKGDLLYTLKLTDMASNGILLMRHTSEGLQNYYLPINNAHTLPWIIIGTNNYHFGSFIKNGSFINQASNDLLLIDPSYKRGALLTVPNRKTP